ncbi:MAG: dihydrofolate reductase family protein, partial [Thermoplasmata archaeon]|nr:dihydrofolate reductase family protein [Thermoplasmata archaeon]
MILDSKGRTPPEAKVLDGSQPTIIATSASSTRAWPEHIQVLRAMGEHVDLRHLLTQLYDLGMRTVMFEGGSKVLASVVRERLFDRLTVFIA